MEKRNMKNSFLVLLTIISMMLLLSFLGCEKQFTNNPGNKYKQFVLAADDIRFRIGTIKHSRYSFEYPTIFNLVDLNKIPDVVMSGQYTEVSFTHKEAGYPESVIYVDVMLPDYNNAVSASNLANDITNFAENEGYGLTSKPLSVSNINALYLKYYWHATTTTYGVANYIAHEESNRIVVFDYRGFIWRIGLNWNFNGDEPTEIEQDFQHIIDTFKILE
jgi:hypothetical protein